MRLQENFFQSERIQTNYLARAFQQEDEILDAKEAIEEIQKQVDELFKLAFN